MCRLPQPSHLIRDLGRHLHQEMIEHGELSFVVWEQSNLLNLQRMDRQALSQKVIERMIREHKFEMDRFVFQIKDKVLPTHINMCFSNMTMVPISGFPRSLLTAENYNSSPRSSQAALPIFQAGLGVVTRAVSRYTHGSRRLKRGAAWKPPSFQDSRSIPNLRQYGDPDRIIGSDVVTQEAAIGSGTENSLPQVMHSKSRPPPTTRPILQQQSSERPEQPSARTTLRNAFRALLWPIRAHPSGRDNMFPEEVGDEEMSQFVASETGKSSTQSHDGWSVEDAFSPGPYSPALSPLTMQYYHVDSAENEIYQQWVNLLGPTMGGAWMPVSQPGHNSWLRKAEEPAVPELLGNEIPAELPADCSQPVELEEQHWI